LNIVIKARILMLVALECREWVLEVFELYNNTVEEVRTLQYMG